MKIPRDWTFKNSDVASCFDKHVREQLPWYDLMTGSVAHIARHYIHEQGVVYDLGCSTGNIGNAIRDTIESRRAKFIPVDNSESMRDIYTGPGDFIVDDISTMDFLPFDLAICFLSLMFLPVESRRTAIQKMVLRANRGGAIVVVDKSISAGGYIGTIMYRLALAGKLAAGVPSEDIISKEMSLAGIQRPMSVDELPGAVEVFRFGDFAGWVIEKA